MELIRQPPNSNLCGQACVAMIARVPLEGAIIMFGHEHRTRTREIVSVLRKYGFRCEDRLIRKRKCLPFPRLCIVKILWRDASTRKQGSHWIVHWDGKFYDPAEYETWNWREKMSSFLEIKGAPWTS
jgi:hypothetical protein